MLLRLEVLYVFMRLRFANETIMAFFAVERRVFAVERQLLAGFAKEATFKKKFHDVQICLGIIWL